MVKRLAKRGRKRKRVPRLVKRFATATDRLLDQIIDDPEKFVTRAERVAEQAARGIDRLVDEYEKNPAKARQEIRNFIVQNLARFSKKRLRAAK